MLPPGGKRGSSSNSPKDTLHVCKRFQTPRTSLVRRAVWSFACRAGNVLCPIGYKIRSKLSLFSYNYSAIHRNWELEKTFWHWLTSDHQNGTNAGSDTGTPQNPSRTPGSPCRAFRERCAPWWPNVATLASCPRTEVPHSCYQPTAALPDCTGFCNKAFCIINTPTIAMHDYRNLHRKLSALQANPFCHHFWFYLHHSNTTCRAGTKASLYKATAKSSRVREWGEYTWQ